MANFFRALGAATPALNMTARTLMAFGQQMREAPMLEAQTALTQQRAEQMKFEMEQEKKKEAELDAPIEGSILFDQFTQGFTEEQKKQGKEMLIKYGILSPDGLTSKRKIADAQKMILMSKQATDWVQTAKRDASLRQGQDLMAKLQKARESKDQGKIDEYTKAYDDWSKGHNLMLGNFENLQDMRIGMQLYKEIKDAGIEIPPEAMAVISAAANTGQNTKEAVAILRDLAVKGKTANATTPTVKTFDVGDKTVTKQWNSETGTWDTISEAPRWQPKEAPTPTEFDKKWARAKAALPPGAKDDEIAKKMKDMFGSGAGGERQPWQIGKDAAALRKEFNALPDVKEYSNINTRLGAMEKALAMSRKGGNMVAVDQALISLYNKMTDPQSVVRESEYARTPSNMPVVNRILGKWDKLMQGGAGLTSDEREALVSMAREINSTYKDAYSNRVNEYRGYAKQSGLDPEQVVPLGQKQPETGGVDIRNRAIQELKNRGETITEERIKWVIQQLGGSSSVSPGQRGTMMAQAAPKPTPQPTPQPQTQPPKTAPQPKGQYTDMGDDELIDNLSIYPTNIGLQQEAEKRWGKDWRKRIPGTPLTRAVG